METIARFVLNGIIIFNTIGGVILWLGMFFGNSLSVDKKQKKW